MHNCTSCETSLMNPPDPKCTSLPHWRQWSASLSTEVTRLRAIANKVDFARDCMDEVEAVMERWRARDGQMRAGDPPRVT